VTVDDEPVIMEETDAYSHADLSRDDVGEPACVVPVVAVEDDFTAHVEVLTHGVVVPGAHRHKAIAGEAGEICRVRVVDEVVVEDGVCVGAGKFDTEAAVGERVLEDGIGVAEDDEDAVVAV